VRRSPGCRVVAVRTPKHCPNTIGPVGHETAVAVQSAANTFTAGAAAMLSWLAVEKVVDGHATSLGAASGVVAGLVGITPGAGFMGIHGALVVGLAAGAPFAHSPCDSSSRRASTTPSMLSAST
jgi:hypothetical protein